MWPWRPSFDRSFRRITSARRFDDGWFSALRSLYQSASPEQRERIRATLGWTDDACRAPGDEELFAADFADRCRALMRSEDTFVADLCRRYERLRDSRDLLLELAGLYHVAILRGFDPDALLARAAAGCPPDAAGVIRSFVVRPDKDLKTWPFEAVRRDDGRVSVQFRGM